MGVDLRNHLFAWVVSSVDNDLGDRSLSASERRGHNLKGFQSFSSESHGQNLALTVLYVPCSYLKTTVRFWP